MSTKRHFYNADLLDILRPKPKFWTILTSNHSVSHKISLVNQDGFVVPKDFRSSVMNAYFSAVFSHEAAENIPVPLDSKFSIVLPVSITTKGIYKLIENLQISSAYF